MNLETALTEIKALPGVTGAKLWSSVPGKERVYVDTVKCNGGKNWNGGVGHTRCYIDIATGGVVMDGEAGAATRSHHTAIGTRAALEAIASTIPA
jgi:hypothetical protein